MTSNHLTAYDSGPPGDPIVDRVILSLSTGFPMARVDDAIRPLIEKWKSLITGTGKGYSRQTYASTSQAVTLTCDLPFHFRGAGNNKIVFIGSICDGSINAIEQAIRVARATKSLAVLIGMTAASESYLATAPIVSAGRYVVLTQAHLLEIFNSDFPKDVLRQKILDQIPTERLVPFSTSVAAEGASFIGRDGELRKLVFGDQDYALCGPGGIGKSSLLRQMQWTLRRNFDERYSRLVEVDLLGVCDLREATRRIAARIQPSRDAQFVSVSSLEPFLRRVRTGDARFHDGPIDLILDEMDSVLSTDRRTLLRQVDKDLQPPGGNRSTHVHSLFRSDEYQVNFRYPLMQVLRLARIQGQIRLTISGRSETRALLDDPQNPFVVDSSGAISSNSRLKLIELGPLNKQESEDMLLGPLRDLKCLDPRDQTCILKRLADCRGIPFHIADLGLELIDKRKLQH